jgi:1-acyl-sn-glycerol-3-phosphate acyltransferase
MMDLLKPPKLYWYWFILLCVKPFYVRIFKIHAVGLESLPKKGPYLLVGNHSHKLDPFFIGGMIGRPIFQMASDEFFRIPIMRRFMWAMGAFPRRKGSHDIKSIKYAIKRVNAGFPLAIYPEGGRNWDGETLPTLRSTAKLVKLLKVPLVTVVSKGNYLSFPRWADKMRRGPITIYYSNSWEKTGQRTYPASMEMSGMPETRGIGGEGWGNYQMFTLQQRMGSQPLLLYARKGANLATHKGVR